MQDVPFKKKRLLNGAIPGLRTLGALIALAAITMAPGCATTPEGEEALLTPQTPLIWPSPPEPARIYYLKTISKPDDIGANKGFLRRVADFILGPKSDRLIKPYGVSVDSKGRLIVADTAFKRVHVFDELKKSYISIYDLGRKEAFESPIAAATDAQDNIYVTDSVAQKVFVFNPKGKLVFSFPAGERPTGIAINSKEGRIYVTDTASHSIMMYDLNGRETGSFGGRGKNPGQFNYPVDLTIGPNGELYVVDSLNFRIQIFDSEGKYLSSFGRQGDGTGDFGRPKGIALDRDGHIYVADALFDTIQVFDREGNFLLNFGALGRSAGTFWLPSGLFIDRGNRIYVSDSYNSRIQVFEYLGQG